MEKKKGVSIFDSAKSKPKATSSAKDKEVVTVRGLETTLLEFQFLKEQIADDEAKLAAVTDEIKQISKEKFIELYKQKKTNPNSFYIKDGSGCVMVIPTDRYISIKEEDRADELIEKYGDEAVTIDEKYYFNPEVLERNMAAIEKLIKDAKTISDADKQDLLIREVKYSISKGFIDRLLPYGNEMENVIDDVQPIITLKNCGGKMADGGVSDEGEFIANVYDNYDAEVGSTITSMYAKGGNLMVQDDLHKLVLNMDEDEYTNFAHEYNIESAQEMEDFIYDMKPFEAEKYIKEIKSGMYGGNYMSDIRVYVEGVGYIYIGKNLDEATKAFDNYYANNPHAEIVMVDYESGEEIKWANTDRNDNDDFKSGGMMAYAYGGKDYRIVGFYSDGFEEDLGNSNDLSEAIEMANVEQMQYPEYVTVKVLEVFGQKNSDYGDYEVVEYYSTKTENKALGGIFGDSRYNSGRSWHQDRARHNKKESYEKPMKYRKRRRI